MSKEKAGLRVIVTAARERLKAEVGERRLEAMERGIGQPAPIEVEVVETSARARLCDLLGEEELFRLERDLIGRMDGEILQ